MLIDQIYGHNIFTGTHLLAELPHNSSELYKISNYYHATHPNVWTITSKTVKVTKKRILKPSDYNQPLK